MASPQGIALNQIGFYRSGPGGAAQPYRIPKGQLFFELITEGAVYEPEGGPLRGVGTIFAHRPGQDTVSRTEGRSHYACLTVSYHLVRAKPPVDWPRCFPWEESEEALRFAGEMLLAFHHAGQDRAVISDLVWSQFRYQLDRYRRRPHGQRIPPRLAALLAHMEQNYAEPLSVEALAERIGLSASHLSAEFRQELGVTLHQYLIRQRMNAAQHRLATTGDPIKVVGASVGYANTENFCRAFKKHTGLTAAAYRRKYRTYER